MSAIIMKLRRHFLDGLSFDDDISLGEKSKLIQFRAPSPLVKLTWVCDDKLFSLDINVKGGKPTKSISKLPDSSGFICFEKDYKPDNCVLLDAYGKERIRLTVPWELTGRDISQNAKMFFVGMGGPFDDPTTGQKGKFGVSACIESADDYFFIATDYYFELDYHAGKFLWAKDIRI
ncbi:MAG: hypothetical protein WCZ86_05185 [Desulfurivibrionaceae bacterium]|jgi:hypothetical protein